MAQFNQQTIRELSELSRIHCSEEEEKKYLKDLQEIFEYFNLLDEIDTKDIQPLNHVIEGMVNVERDDVVGKTLAREVFLDNAPAQIGGMIRVPTVIKGQ